MSITANRYARTVQQFLKKTVIANSVLLLLLSACATERALPVPSPIPLVTTEQDTQSDSKPTGAQSLSVPSDPANSTELVDILDLSTSKKPEEFVLDVINMMETSPGKCGVAAKNTPQVNWTCAKYTKNLRTFVATWDKVISSAEFALNHSYTETSGWMYFEIDGEIDFFWKTYDLETTQALVAYDPSEVDSELIIGLNPDIGSKIAAANGSHSFNSASQLLPVQK